MLDIARLSTGLTAVCAATAAIVAVATSPRATADPTIPLDPGQLPGLEAVQSLSPVIQAAAANPKSAQELLLAAASQLAGNATTPQGSLSLAEAVTRFVQEGGAAGPSLTPPLAMAPQPAVVGMAHGTTPLMTPGPGNGPIPLQQHVPAPGAVPGTEAHLPAGINPEHAAGPILGPVSEVMPEVPVMISAPGATPAAIPAAATAVEAGAALGAAPAAAPVAAPSYDPNTPPTQDFLYPSMSNGCLADGGNVIATAISVAGPATIPVPGPGPGQTAYVFTAVGTPAPAAEQKLPLNVTWVNLTTGRSGSATLKPNPGINPAGPTTLTAIVDTGSGSIMSTIFGQVTTVDKQCTFMPTIGSSVVP